MVSLRCDRRQTSTQRKKTVSEGPGGASVKREVTGACLRREGRGGLGAREALSWEPTRGGTRWEPGPLPRTRPSALPAEARPGPWFGSACPPNPGAAGPPLFVDVAVSETSYRDVVLEPLLAGGLTTSRRRFLHSAGPTAAVSACSLIPNEWTGPSFGLSVSFSLTPLPCGGEAMMPLPKVTQ